MKRKNTLVLIFLVFLSINICASEKLGLMPFLGLSRTSSSVEMLGEKEAITGYEAGVEYQWQTEGEIKTASRLGLKNINADSGNFLASYEVEMNILTIGQSISYEYGIGENILKPFAAVDIGAGLSKASINLLGESSESDDKFLPFASFSTGARFEIGQYVPFVTAGYQYAVVDDLGFAAFDSSSSNEVDFSGTFITVGLGMLF